MKWSASEVSTQAFQYFEPIYWHSQSCAQPLQDKHRGALLKDIENGLQQFLQDATSGRVHGMYLAGGVALTQGICEWVTQATHIPCDVFDPFQGLAVHQELDRHTVQKEAAHYVSACGLALRTPA